MLLIVVVMAMSGGGEKQGFVAIASEEPDVEVIFEGPASVKVNVPEAHDFQLKPGDWKARLEKPKPGLIVEPAEFRVAAGQTQKVFIRKVAAPQPPIPVVGVPKLPPLAVAPFDAKKAQEFQQLWAKHLSRQIEETNSIGMKLRLIPPGEFIMGRGRFAGSPKHPVALTRPFYLGTFEVTQGEFEKIMNANPSKGSPGPVGAAFPVGAVSWEGAAKFCRELSARPEEIAASRRYRLPTEAEWEYACLAGAGTRFSFGDECTAKDAGFKEVGKIVAVGSYPANAFGLRDMHGNVREWCADWFDLDYAKTGPRENPMGPWAGSKRIVRGGGANDPPSDPTYRQGETPDIRYSDVVFRVVCEIGPQPDTTFFNGKDLTGWGKSAFFRVENGELIGTGANSRLAVQRVVRDFRLDFEAKTVGGSFLVIRQEKDQPNTMLGLHSPGDVWDESVPGWKHVGKVNKAGQQAIKRNDYNAIEVAAIGKRLTIKVNGVLAQEADYPLPAEGRLFWMLGSDGKELRVKNIRFTDLSAKTGRHVNAVGMEFALIPKGKSWLGGGGGKVGDKEVEFKDDFYLGVYEVTQEEWQKVMGRNPSNHSRTGREKDRVENVHRRRVEAISRRACVVAGLPGIYCQAERTGQ